MSRKTSIAVIFGGRSGEHEVSLMSARSVLAVLDAQKFDVVQIGITHTGEWLTGENVIGAFESGKLDELIPVTLLPEPKNGLFYTIQASRFEPLVKVDVVFPVLHGTFGEDGTMQGLLELADVAYIGAGVLASSVGMDKSLFKDVMRANNVPVVESLLTTRWEISTAMNELIARIERVIPYPVFIKPVNMGSSVGITKCRSRSDLLEGLIEAARYDRRVLVERGVNCREIEVSVLGNEAPEASVVGEIRPSDDFYTYSAKYLDGASELIIPARLDPVLMQSIRDLAVRAYKAIDGAGMARVDFLLDRDTNEVYLSEVNTIPGFTNISMYSKLWEASGLPYGDLVQKLIDFALQRKQERDMTEHVFRSGE